MKRYTALTIDLLATYDATTERIHYVPAAELGNGRATITLRVAPTANNQVKGIRMAASYEELPATGGLVPSGRLVEPAGIEPATSNLQNSRSPN